MYKEYFKEIFQSSKTVIIPGLGSFTKASETDDKINFNPYLKFNDGFLAGFIAKKQGVSIDEAGKSIAESVEKIQEALNQKGEALVLGLGILSKTTDGKIEFKVDASASPKPEEVKKTIPVVEEVKKVVVEAPKVIETPKPIVPEVKVVEKPTVVEEKIIENTKAKIPEIKNDVTVSAPTLTVVDTKAENKSKKELKKEKVKEVKIKEPKVKKERKKLKFPIWLIIVLVLVLGGGTFTALKWEMVKGWLGMNAGSKTEKPKEEITKNETKQEEPSVEGQPGDTTAIAEEPVAIEEAKVEEPVVEEKSVPVKVQPVQTTNGNFHVITGNFTNQNLASKMVEKLTAEGHQGNNLGLRGTFYMISAGDYSTLEEAKAKLEAIKATYPKAYIYNGL